MALQLPSIKTYILNLYLLFVLTKVQVLSSHCSIVECCPMGILDCFLSIEEGAIQADLKIEAMSECEHSAIFDPASGDIGEIPE